MDLFKTMFSRQSIRDFNDENPSVEDITTILRAAMAAPIGRGRYEDVHLTVISDPQWIANMSNYVNTKESSIRPNAPFYKAPTLILISCKLKDNYTLDYTNAGCVVQNMALAARGLDLGHIILWSFIKHLKENEELFAALNLPKDFTPIIALGVGLPTEILQTSETPRHSITINKI